MTPSDGFVLIKFVLFLLLLAFQWAGFAAVRASRFWNDGGKARRRLVVALFVAMNLPCVGVAFLPYVGLPGGVLRASIAVSAIWQLGWIVAAAGRAIDRAATAVAVRWTRTREGKSVPAVDAGRRAFLANGARATILVAGGSAIASVDDGETFDIGRRVIRVARLPARLRGFRIAMVADVHSGPYMSPERIARYTEVVNGLHADLVLLPGDFVNNRDEEIEPVCEAFRRLSAPFGVYGCTGNHDHYADADVVCRELERAGVRMLRNTHLDIDPHGERLSLIGIDDVRTGHPFHASIAEAVRGLGREAPSILLCHKPYYLDEAAEWGFDLMLSGHTHGGQIVLGRAFGAVITPAALVSGYIEGWYRSDATQLYITRGLGVVGIPIRINCPPEVTEITLV